MTAQKTKTAGKGRLLTQADVKRAVSAAFSQAIDLQMDVIRSAIDAAEDAASKMTHDKVVRVAGRDVLIREDGIPARIAVAMEVINWTSHTAFDSKREVPTAIVKAAETCIVSYLRGEMVD
jgi:hypothetical protein